MLEFLFSWQTWVFVAAVVIVVVYIMCRYCVRVESHSKKKRSKKCYSYSEEEESSSEEEERRKKKRKSPRLEVSVSESEYEGEALEPILPEEFINQYDRPESTRAPLGNPSKGELLCLEAVEKIYGVKFHRSVWPPWLRNPETNKCLELDIYNEQLKIAVEYHGRQHYEYVPHFHRNGIKDFESQKRRDNYKLDICDEKGVYVITVPYNVPDDKIEDFIRYWTPEAVAAREGRKKQL